MRAAHNSHQATETSQQQTPSQTDNVATRPNPAQRASLDLPAPTAMDKVNGGKATTAAVDKPNGGITAAKTENVEDKFN